MKAPAAATNPEAIVDPAELFELLENHYGDTGGEEGSPYGRLLATSMEAGLEAEGVAAIKFHALLSQVDAATPVETAIRRTGFILGFESCRQLLMGELNLAALEKKGRE